MIISPLVLALRLRQARESCGLSQDAVAQTIGVSRPALVEIEQGSRSVTRLELAKLAFLFARDMRDFFREQFPAEDAFIALVGAEIDATDHGAVQQRLRERVALAHELANLKRLLGIAEGDGDPDEAGRRLIGLGLDAHRRELITGGKLRQLGSMAGLDPDALDQLIASAKQHHDDADGAPPALLPGL